MASVSIYIPAYNAERFIVESVTSAARQGLGDVEIVVIDDGSTDETGAVCRRFGSLVEGVPFRYLANGRNLGGGATRNRCIEVASGDYLFNLDADNVLPDGLVAILLEKAELTLRRTGKHVMVSPELLQYFEDVPARVRRLRLPGTRRTLRHSWRFSHLDYRFVLTRPESPASSGQYLFHRDVARTTGGFFEDCGPFDTWSFGVRAYVAGYRYVAVPGAYYLHRLHGESYWTRNAVSGRNRDYLWRAIRHFPDIYAHETFEALNPDNATYPAEPFEAIRVRCANHHVNST